MARDPDLVKTAGTKAESVLIPEEDAQIIAIADGLSELRLAKAAENQAVADETRDGAALRERADALGELAQQTQGKRRNELLDEADNLDALAEARDEDGDVDKPDSRSTETEITTSTRPTSPKTSTT